MRPVLFWISMMAVATPSWPGRAMAQEAPAILTQPQSRSVSSRANVTFSVEASGTAPLSYRWLFNNAVLANATNTSLTLSNVNLFRGGAYSVIITNAFGAITSEVAMLRLDEDLTFRILELRTNGAITVEVSTITGDDRGGMAVGRTNVFLTGDTRTGRWGVEFLNGGANLSNRFEALVSDLQTETVYSLGNGSTLLGFGGGTASTLIQIDGDTGLVTESIIPLSTNIFVSSGSGLFSGYGRIVLHTGNRAFSIALPSGIVTDLGSMPSFPHSSTESWAYWGLAEYIGNTVSLVYVQDSQTMARRIAPNGPTTVLGHFLELGEMASFTFSRRLSRWIFHFEGTAQFGNGDELLGSAKALFTTDPGHPYFILEPQSTSSYPGSNATLTVLAEGTPPLTYQWSLNGKAIDGATNATLDLIDVQESIAGIYTVKVENNSGQVVSSGALLTLVTAPIILTNPADRQGFPEGSVTFTVVADGVPPLSYQWRFNGAPLSDGTNSTLLLTNLQPTNGGIYSVQVTNLYGEIVSDGALLTIVTTPSITTQPANRTVLAGANVSFSASVSGAPPLNYQWRLNGTNLAGATNLTLILSNVQGTNSGLYSVQVTNLYGTATSSNATLRVITVPEFNNQPLDITVLPGTNVSFSVSVSGPAPLRYQWRLNGNDLAGATNSLLTITNVQPSQAGLYSVRVTNTYGASISSNALLTVITIVDDGSIFQITSLTTNGALAIECGAPTGDDRGGIAVSTNYVLLTGDSSTVRFSATNLSGTTALGRVIDSLCANLRTETIYSLASGTNLIANPGGFISSLLELNPANGQPNGVRLNLSRTINATTNSGNVGIFSGYDEIVIVVSGRGYKIALPSGQVSDLGVINSLTHNFSENWAYWGVAEHVGGYTYIVYARNSQSISRTRFPDGLTTTLLGLTDVTFGTFELASFTVSIPRSRWYYHYENQGVFRSGDETIGYANASFLVNSGTNAASFEWDPIPAVQAPNQPFSVRLTAKTTARNTATNFDAVVTLSGIAGTNGGSIPISPTTISNFVGGVWTGQVTVLQPSSNMVLRGDDRAGTTGNSSLFSVAPSNDLFVVLAGTPNPVLASQPVTYEVTVRNTGPSAATGVRLTNTLPANVTFLSAIPSQGQCSNSANLVLCDLETISSAATVSIIVVPLAAGSITNRATATRIEADATLTNNTASLVIQVILPSLSIGDILVVEGNSGTNEAILTVTLSLPSTNSVSVAFATGGGTAATTGTNPDYLPKSGVVVFPPGVITQTISISVRGDLLYEGNDTFNVTLSAATNAMIGRGQATCTLQNDDAPPSISISDIAVSEGDSGTSLANFQIVLSAQSGLQATYAFATSNGTAQAGSDYVARSAAFGFGANTTALTQNIAITINGDTMSESNEFFYLLLTSVSNAVIGRGIGTGVLLNDDGSGSIDHFLISAVPTPQQPNTDIPITITARDLFATTLTNFNGMINLSATAESGIGVTNFFGGAQFTNTGFGDYTIGYAFTTKSNLTVTHVRHYCGKKITLWTDAGAVVFSQNVVSQDGKWLETALPAPVLLTSNTRYRLAFYTGGTNGNYYLDFDRGTNFDHVTLEAGVFGMGDTFPTNETITGWAVDLSYLFGSALGPVAITPTLSGSFSNGVWSGAVRLLDAATNVIIEASDNQQHRGTSNPFDVIRPTTTDLALSANAATTRMAVGSNLVFTLIVTNRGTEAAFGVAVAVPLPANMSFLSATTGLGSCSNQGNVVACRMPSLNPNAAVTLTVVARVDAPGTHTNIVSASFAGTDPVPANNAVTLSTTAFLDRDGDGMPDDWETLYNLDRDDSSDAAQDADGDGVTNLNEFLADTNPRDPASFIDITGVRMIGGDVWIRFHGVAGRRYRLEYSVTMGVGDWAALIDFRIGRLLETELIDTGNAVPGRTYRVRQLP